MLCLSFITVYSKQVRVARKGGGAFYFCTFQRALHFNLLFYSTDTS
jgi:hypothetical protein